MDIRTRQKFDSRMYIGTQQLTYTLLYKQHLFSTQPQFCLVFYWIKSRMLLKCCLIHINITLLIHFLCLVYLYLCLRQFTFYLCNLFFIIIFIFIKISPQGVACLLLKFFMKVLLKIKSVYALSNVNKIQCR